VKQVLAPTTAMSSENGAGPSSWSPTGQTGRGIHGSRCTKRPSWTGRTFYLPLSKNKWASPNFVQECKDDCGGEDTIEYRAEYECEWVFDDETTVVPEFTQKRAFEGDEAKKLPPIVREIPGLRRQTCTAPWTLAGATTPATSGATTTSSRIWW
jgi:hypothetical protein